MREVVDAELVYDLCACGAVWFDRKELEEYGRRYEARVLEPEAPRAKLEGPMGKRCPRCAVELRALVVDGMRVGACATCRGHFVEHASRWAEREKVSESSYGLCCLNGLSSLFGSAWWA